MKKFITNKHVLTILGILLFFLLWEIISLIINEPTLIFPGPIKTIAYVGSLLGNSFLYQSIGYTFLRMLMGFIISFLLALIIGSIAGNNKSIETILKPTITVLKAIPTAAIVFLFLVMSGTKFAPILIVMLMSFPILYDAVVGGFNNIPHDILNALKIEQRNKWSGLIKIKLPQAWSYVVVGIASSFALSFKIEIMAEIIIGDNSPGLGSAIRMMRNLYPSDMTPVFAYSFIAIVIILIISLLAAITKKYYSKKFA